MTKSLPVSKEMVQDSYLKVVDKDGGAGIDRQSIEMFNKDLSGNLYKIWNRMASGSYFQLWRRSLDLCLAITCLTFSTCCAEAQ